MRIISESRIREWSDQYPDASEALTTFLKVARKAKWRHLQDMRETYRHADAVEVASGRVVTVLNIRGNLYRMIVAVHYNTGKVFLLRFLTHAEYNRGAWSKTL